MANDFFANSASAGYLGKSLVGVPVQNTGYPKGVAITTPFALTALTRLHTITARGESATATMEIYDGSGFFFGEPLASGSSGPGQFVFSPSATGVDCQMFTANISGFDGTVLGPVAAGWTQITGRNSSGQSATKLTIFQNGLTRWVLDKTTGTSTPSVRIYHFDATGLVWRFVGQNEFAGSHSWQDLTITAVNVNSAAYIEVTFTSKNISGVISTSKLRITRGLPYATIQVTSIAASSPAVRTLSLQHTEEKTVFFERAANTPEAHDTYGFLGFNSATTVQAFWTPIPAFNMDVFISRSSDTGLDVFTAAESIISFVSYDGALTTTAFGFMPRVYGAGDANLFYGNNDGQFRDAEGHRVWEGETPLVGTELLTNGQFETDLTGWTQTAGVWTRVTTQKKFGNASVQVSPAASTAFLTQQLSGLTIGAVYAISGWVRSVSATVASSTRFDFALTANGSGLNPSVPADVAAGQEWTYLTGFWTATQATVFARIRSANTGSTEFDGVSVVQVKDAAGVSTLAFDTRSTTGWLASGTGASIVGIVDSPRGKAIRIDFGSTNFTALELSFSKQDLSRFTRSGMWLRRVSGTATSISILHRTATGVATGQSDVGVSGSLSADWQFRTASPLVTLDGVTSCGNIRIQKDGTSTSLVLDIGPITLSEFDISIGARHGLLDPLEDASLVLWLPLDESSGTFADRSGNGHVGTAAGSPTYSAATVRAGLGTCIDFDGVDDTISVPDANSLDLTTAITLEAWVFTDTVAAGTARFLSKNSSYNLRRSGADIILELAGLSDDIMAAVGALVVSTWTHVAATYDGAMKRIYVNGALHSSEAATGTIGVTTNLFYIGSTGGSAEFWDGKIDEPRLYNRALGPEEVAMRYNATSQRLARWVPSASLKLEQTTDKVDGTYAIKATPSANDQTMTMTMVPMDLSSTLYSHFGVWTKQTVADDTFIRIGSDASNYRQWTITGSTAFAYNVKVLGTPDSTVGTPDMSRVTHIMFGDMDTAGTAFFVDSLKLMSGAETGDWRYAVNANGSTGYTLKTLTTPVLNSIPRTYSVNAPAPGVYYIGVGAVATGSGGLMECTFDGVASGTPQAVSTTSLATQTTQNLFGPYTITTAGDKVLEVKITTVGSMTAFELDFVALYPYSSTASTPVTSIMPKNLAHAVLRPTAPAV